MVNLQFEFSYLFLFLVTLSFKGGEPNEKEITEGDRCFKHNERF